jgi:hypothetical protein
MTGAYPGPEQLEPATGAPKTSGTATVALVAGIFSFICLFGLGGIVAIILGWVALSEIDRSEGRLSGRGLASTGLGLGIANLVACVVGIGVLVALAVRPEAPTSTAPPPPPAAPPLRAPISVPELSPPAPDPAPAPTALATLPTLPPHIGKISIVETADSDALERQLLTQLAETSRSGERLVLWTVTPDCEPCAAVGRALPDARMQKALSGVRLVRTDASTYAPELARLGVPIESVPGFTLLDARARPLDHIHGGEWGDDIPANIAPILDKFVRHTLSSRRYQWARPLRDGETPL